MNPQQSPTIESDQDQNAVIKVFGVGGGGCNALEKIITSGMQGVQFKCINTDAQALSKFPPEDVIQLGSNLTRGLGAGANPEIGKEAAEESRERIAEAIGNTDMLFITSGMGGGTGTGAAPIVANIAREMGVLTVAVVTEPFAFEGDKRKKMAKAGLTALRENADSMIVVPNENLLTHLGPDVTLIEAFAAANDVVTNAVQSIAELITTNGLINVDFADVKSVMTEMGHAIMSTGTGMGEHRARDAAVSAIESPLLNNVDLKEARGILANITASKDLSMGEFQVVGDIIRKIAADDANVVIGTVLSEQAGLEVQVTVVATGLNPPETKTNKPKNTFKSAAKAADTAPATDSPKKADKVDTAAKADTAEDKSESTSDTSKEVSDTPFEFNQPAKAAATPDTPKAVKSCYICGNPENDHKEKCPWKNGKPDDAADDELLAEDTSVASTESAGRLSKNQKKGMAGVVAGVLALGGVFYMATSTQNTANNTVNTNIAETTESQSQSKNIRKLAKEFDLEFSPISHPISSYDTTTEIADKAKAETLELDIEDTPEMSAAMPETGEDTDSEVKEDKDSASENKSDKPADEKPEKEAPAKTEDTEKEAASKTPEKAVSKKETDSTAKEESGSGDE